MDLEVRVTDERDFKELKQYAEYYSEITKVMTFNPSVMNKGVVLLDKYFKKDDSIPINEENLKFIIDIDDKKKIFIIAPDSYIAFCGGTKPKGSSMGFVPISSLKEIYILMKYDLIRGTENFNKWFSKLDKNCKLSELHSFTNKKEFRGNKKWTFLNYYTEEFEAGKIRIEPSDLTVERTKIFSIINNSPIPILNEIRGKVMDVNYKAKKALLDCCGMTVEVEMHGWAPFKYDCWLKDKEIRLLYKKMYGDTSYKKIIDPIVIPEDLKIVNKEEFFKEFMTISNRRFPSELLNRMYFEYKLRTL